MSVVNEFLQIQPNLPLASGNVIGIDTTYLIALGTAATAGVGIRKLTPYLHETIGPNELGVLLHKGNPVERKIVSEEELQTERGQKQYHRVKITTEARIETGESPYVISGPGFYMVPPFKTLERVYIAHQVSKLGFDIMSKERHLAHVETDVTWRVSPKGNKPIDSITHVKHIKQDKKDVEQKNKNANEDAHFLASQILSICAAGLGRYLTGKTMDQLQYMNKKQKQLTKNTIKECETDVSYYGGEICAVRLMPITWKDNETIAQAIRSLGDSSIASRVVNASAEVKDTITGIATTLTLAPDPAS